MTEGWYDASLFDNETGRALPALYELKNFANGSSGIQAVYADGTKDESWYSLDGQRLNKKPSKKGIYIHQQQKNIIR